MTGTGDAWKASAPNDRTALVSWLEREGWQVNQRYGMVDGQLDPNHTVLINPVGGRVPLPRVGVVAYFTATGRMRAFQVRGPDQKLLARWESGEYPLAEARQRLWTALQEVTDG